MSEKNSDRLPIWIGCPDLPVPKYQKQSLRNATINDGLHFHVICLIPPESRLTEPLQDHVAHHQQLYKGKAGTVSELDVRRIVKRPKYTTRYALKSIPKRRVSNDEIIILPRSQTEL
jgi:hypothetical protein